MPFAGNCFWPNNNSTTGLQNYSNMARFLKSIAALGLVTSVLGHAVMQTPQPRVVSTKTESSERSIITDHESRAVTSKLSYVVRQ